MSEEIIHDRRRFLKTAAMTVIAARLGVLGSLGKLMARTTLQLSEAFAFTFG